MQEKKQLPADWGKSTGKPKSWDNSGDHSVRNQYRSEGEADAERNAESFSPSNPEKNTDVHAALTDTEAKADIIGDEGKQERNRPDFSDDTNENQEKQYAPDPSGQADRDQSNAKPLVAITAPPKKPGEPKSGSIKEAKRTSRKAAVILPIAVISVIALVTAGIIVQKRDRSDRSDSPVGTDEVLASGIEETASAIPEITTAEKTAGKETTEEETTVEETTEKETAAEKTTVEESAANETEVYLVVDIMGNTEKMNDLDSAIQFVTYELEFGGKVLDSDLNVVYEYYPDLKGSDDSEQEATSSEQSSQTSDNIIYDSSADWSDYAGTWSDSKCAHMHGNTLCYDASIYLEPESDGRLYYTLYLCNGRMLYSYASGYLDPDGDGTFSGSQFGSRLGKYFAEIGIYNGGIHIILTDWFTPTNWSDIYFTMKIE